MAFLRRLVGGWQLNMISVMQTGIPLTVRGASNFAADRPNSTGVSAKLDNPTRAALVRHDAFVNPPDFVLGNVGRTIPDVRTPGAVNFDISVIKDTSITERVNLQFRAESFNFLNQVNLGAPNDISRRAPTGRTPAPASAPSPRRATRASTNSD